MPQLIQTSEADFPPELRRQALELSYLEWPQAFSAPPKGDEALNDPALDPVCIALVEDGCLLSYTGVQSLWFGKGDEVCRVSGISGMLTRAAQRGRGAGRQVLVAASAWMARSGTDFGIFTCDPPLVAFYARAGWIETPTMPLVGGTREQPFPSAQFGKVTLAQAFTPRGQARLVQQQGRPIELELGVGNLW
ncbi:GNAT family N-acetyltransferase [Chitinimonas lacunae]|uniref:GNAT family N-acetyltransferase n=1 Tax=Chitinimonas lacunae TaxID=1963018 RepID=A0ABV8MNF8_9NEIS